MKASELITQLREFIETNGDLPVVMSDWNEQYSEPTEVRSARVAEQGIVLDA